MNLNFCLFEDEKSINLHPLSYTRPVYDLRTGILSLKEKILKRLKGETIYLHCRAYLNKLVAEENIESIFSEFEIDNDDEIIFINGRLIADDEIIEKVYNLKTNTMLCDGSDLIAVRFNKTNIPKLNSDENYFNCNNIAGIEKIAVSPRMINYPWDLVNANGEEIINDVNLLKPEKSDLSSYKNATFLNEENIFIGDNVKFKPGAIIDAEDGPVYIGNNVTVQHNAVVQGPAYVGDGSTIKIGAKIYHNTSIGDVCKVGGEIEDSIIHSYSNKQHDGFLGHSYLGSWVNLGADTNNSDLKNNYGVIKTYINNKLVNTGSQFVGLTMGDHSKTAINTMFNTGTVVGVSCNIFGSSFPPVYIPSFSWGGSDVMKDYSITKSIEVAGIVKERRNKVFSENEIDVMKHIHEMTEDERAKRKRVIG